MTGYMLTRKEPYATFYWQDDCGPFGIWTMHVSSATIYATRDQAEQPIKANRGYKIDRGKVIGLSFEKIHEVKLGRNKIDEG